MDGLVTALLALLYLTPVFLLFALMAALADWLEARS